MSTTPAICILIASLTGCTATDVPTRTQRSLDERWAQGASIDTGLAGTLVVLNKAEASASLIDGDTGREVAKAPTGTGPHEVAISPDGLTAVVANYGTRQPGHTLTVIDIPAGCTRATIDLKEYHRPHGIRFLPDGNRVIVTVEVQQAVIIVDVESRTVETVIRTNQNVSHMLVLSPSADRVYVTSIGSGSLVVIDMDRREVIATIPTGGGAEGLDISPDGREVWVANRQSGTLSIIDTQTLEIVATLRCSGFPLRVKFTPDGAHVLVSAAHAGDVRVFDTATREEIKQISMRDTAGEDERGEGPVPIGIQIDPAGRYAFIANAYADDVAVLDLATWKIHGRLTAGKEPDGLGYSTFVAE